MSCSGGYKAENWEGSTPLAAAAEVSDKIPEPENLECPPSYLRISFNSEENNKVEYVVEKWRADGPGEEDIFKKGEMHLKGDLGWHNLRDILGQEMKDAVDEVPIRVDHEVYRDNLEGPKAFPENETPGYTGRAGVGIDTWYSTSFRQKILLSG